MGPVGRFRNGLLCLSLGCGLACEPNLVLGIDGTSEKAVITMRVKNTPITPQAIQLFRSGEPVKKREVELCSLVRTAAEASIRGEWIYGAQADGYRLGRCAPLETGKSYDLHVAGPGPGSTLLRFTVETDGKVRPHR